MGRVAVDAMGGDHAPAEVVRGALQAVEQSDDLEVILVGAEDRIRAEFADGRTPERVRIEPAADVIEMDELPVDAVRRKPDSSIVRGMTLLAAGGADCLLSAGNTGGVVAAARFKLKRLPGARRAGIAAPFPARDGVCLLIDVGANLRCTPVHLVQYALMATEYARDALGIADPRVALLSVGEEDSKGSPLVKTTAEALRAMPDVNFAGNVEGQHLFDGGADVIVCEGFVGNVILKSAEGLSEAFLRHLVERLEARLGADNAIAEELEVFRHRTDYTRYGGAPLLGHERPVFICHGRSPAGGIAAAITKADAYVSHHVNDRIAARLEAMSDEPALATVLGGQS